MHETFADLQQGARVKVEFSSRTGSDVTASEIDLSSRNNDPLLVGGQSLTSVTLHVTANTFLFRKDRNGGGRGVIRLGQVVPGSDRIWFRGTVTGPGQVDADWVRVRTN